MTWTSEDSAMMDSAARDAARELLELVEKNVAADRDTTATEVQAWMAKWWRTAGYKRLCRTLRATSFSR